MKLKGKKVVSRASGIKGVVTGIDKSGMRVSFTEYQDIAVPFARMDNLLVIDEETKQQICRIVGAAKSAEGKK